MNVTIGLPRLRSLIDGNWIDGKETVVLHYPYDNRPVAEIALTALADVAAAVESSQRAFENWRRQPGFERARVLSAMAQLMRRRKTDLVEAMRLHTGKPVRDGEIEVARAVTTMEVSAEEAKRIGGEVVPMETASEGRGLTGFAIYQPLGVIAGIIPFNSPLNLLAHKLGPAIAAGDTLVLKPHPQGSGVAAIMGEISLAAELPPGVFNIVHGGADVGRALTTHPEVALVNFTGSSGVAEAILREIGLKRTLMELGGNAPTIIHGDADWERAVKMLIPGAFGLAGQSCVSTQRIYVHQSIIEEFIASLLPSVQAMRVGDPNDPATDIGPMNSLAAAERVSSWVNEAIEAGATLLCGGKREQALVWPTVLANVRPEMKVVCEEVFGPVASLVPYRELDEVIRAANATPWGLKAGVFTESLSVAMRMARELDFGSVNINAPSRSRTDYEPSGGVKKSGWGREGPAYAIRELSSLKMITINSASPVRSE